MLELFFQAYLRAALFSSTVRTYREDENGEEGYSEDVSLDECVTIDDIDESAKAQIRQECQDFLTKVSHLTESWNEEDFEKAGDDFFSTRHHHGVGFWDGSWETEHPMTEIAHSFRETDFYLGDDGKVYVS